MFRRRLIQVDAQTIRPLPLKGRSDRGTIPSQDFRRSLQNRVDSRFAVKIVRDSSTFASSLLESLTVDHKVLA
jgi:hypothetical protein